MKRPSQATGAVFEALLHRSSGFMHSQTKAKSQAPAPAPDLISFVGFDR